ncbi:hypothetical protein HK101_009218 [Irineochytrium annulatum]|nr:hypothetical protein HK101_009218 [Irineochytrium annulatum]
MEMNATDPAATVHGGGPSSKVLTHVMIIEYAIGFPLNAIVVAAYIKHRRKLLVRTIDYLFLVVILSHLVWCVLFAWVQGYIVVTLGGFSETPRGILLCEVAGIMLLETAGHAITVHMLMSIDRWLVVVAKFKDTRPTLFTISACVELLFVGFGVAQMHSTRTFEPAESGLYCFFPFVTSRPDFRDLAVTIFVSGFCVSTATVVLGAYGHIYFRAIRIRRRASMAPPPEIVSAESGDGGVGAGGPRHISSLGSKYANEVDTRQVFFRCIGILAVFLASYSFEFANFGYRLIVNGNVAGWVDGVASTMAAADTVATPIMIVCMNENLLKAVESLVGFTLPPWRGRRPLEEAGPLIDGVGIDRDGGVGKQEEDGVGKVEKDGTEKGEDGTAGRLEGASLIRATAD